MTTTLSLRFLLLCLAAAALLALALAAVPYVGLAHADPAPTPAAAAPASPAPATPIAQPPESPDIGTVERLWRSGSIIPAGLVGLYLAIAFLFRLDRRRAFYWGGALTALGLLVETAARGATPTIGMFLAACGTLAAIVARGPEPRGPGTAGRPYSASRGQRR